MKTKTEGFIGLALVLAMIPCEIFAQLFVILQIWKLYLVPEGLPAISGVGAWGLTLVIAMAGAGKKSSDDKFKDLPELFGIFVGRVVLVPGAILAMAGLSSLVLL